MCFIIINHLDSFLVHSINESNYRGDFVSLLGFLGTFWWCRTRNRSGLVVACYQFAKKFWWHSPARRPRAEAARYPMMTWRVCLEHRRLCSTWNLSRTLT